VSVSVGSLVNYGIALTLLARIPGLIPQLASLGGIGAATVVNFVALKYIVFKRKHYRPP
jgi:putative flippase GtrA